MTWIQLQGVARPHQEAYIDPQVQQTGWKLRSVNYLILEKVPPRGSPLGGHFFVEYLDVLRLNLQKIVLDFSGIFGIMQLHQKKEGSQLKKVEFSSHALFDREERIVWIATEVGFGEVIDTIVIYDEERNYRRVELTETGVAIIKAVDKEFVITMYLPTQRQLVKWYGSKNAVPIRLMNIAKRNEKRGWANNGL